MEKFLIIGMLLLATILIIYLLFFWLNKAKVEYSNFLNNLGGAKPSELKGNIFKNQRYGLIKNFITMKKYLGWSIFLLVVVITALGTFIVIDSRDFFQEFFEIEKNKILLRTEESVDSLQTEIQMRQQKLDSIFTVHEMLKTNFDGCMKENNKLFRTNQNLNNVINHQNNMVEKLVKEKDNLNKLLKDSEK